MSNVEGMYTVYFKKRLSKAKPHFEILRFDIQHSAVRCSNKLGYRNGNFNPKEIMKTAGQALCPMTSYHTLQMIRT